MPAEGVGQEHPDVENSNGTLFRGFLTSTGMAAVNTFVDAGATWVSAYLTEARIDYICVPLAVAHMVDHVMVRPDIDVSPADREDHRVLFARVACTSSTALSRSAAGPRIDLRALNVPWRLEAFKSALWSFEPARTADVHEHAHELVTFTKRAALRAFGSSTARPRKPWITQVTWAELRLVPGARRTLHAAAMAAKAARAHVVFIAWAGACAPTFHMARGMGALGWPARAACVDVRRRYASALRAAAAACRDLVALRWRVRHMVKADRDELLIRMAAKCQRACDRNDFKASFAVVRALSAFKPKQLKAVAMEDGSLSTSEEQRQARWVRHFAGVFGARVVTSVECLKTEPSSPVTEHGFSPTLQQVIGAVRHLPNGKAVGPDGLPAEVIKAGGDVFGIKLFDVVTRIVDSEVFPVQWKGGRIADLFKGKGSATVCDDSRGLLIGDHCGKAFVSLLKDDLEPLYQASIPNTQFGAVAGGGTDYPHHMVRSAIDHAAAHNLSICVVFIDLVKAFDRVLRELIFGFPQGVINREAHLLSLGLSAGQAAWVLQYLDKHGTVLERWGADPKTIALVNALHSGSWFQYADHPDLVAAAKGGRQGCKLGSLIFNAGYTDPLRELTKTLRELGVVLRLPVAGDTDGFWAAAAGGDFAEDSELVDAAFVDDEVIVIMATSPAALDASIDATLHALIDVFGTHLLDINWARGKSEALLKYRGQDAVARWEARRGDAGNIAIRLPCAAGRDELHVVDRYRHLGGIVSISGTLLPEAHQRASSAMAAYSPLAKRVFGATEIHVSLRLLFATMLVVSRLAFNVHTWVVTVPALRVINGPYMRVLRRIAGAMRFGPGAPSDYAVREQLQQPSIDCLIMRRRLLYVARIVACKPLALIGLLRGRRNGQPLPWVRQMHGDLTVLHNSVLRGSACPLAHPDAGLEGWPAWIAGNLTAWRACVGQLFFTSSILDASAADTPGVRTMACSICSGEGRPAFLTQRSLAQHMRIAHNVRSPMRAYAPASGLCAACGVCFQTRLRLLGHLSDARRPKCREWHLLHATPLDAATMARLDTIDAAARLKAQRLGLTGVPAGVPARRPDGRVTGKVHVASPV